MVTKEIINKRLNRIYEQACREITQIGMYEWSRINWNTDNTFHQLRVIIYHNLACLELIKDSIFNCSVHSIPAQELYRELDELCTAADYRGIKV